MRYLIVIFSIVLIGFFTVPATAQHSGNHHGQSRMMKSDTASGMMQGGMMSGIMGSQGKSGKCPMCGKMMQGGMMK